MSVYEDSGWYEAAGKLEPQLGTTNGLSTELVITRGEEARKRLQELAAHDLLFNEFHFELFDPCYSHQDSIVKFAVRHHELMEKHKEATFPHTSQNQAVSSGAEGAHEGTTADKSEPEKLNNAPDPLDYFLVTYGFDGNNHARQMLISCWAAARQYERKQAAESSLSQEEDLLKQGFEGLRDAAIRLRDESSLSSPSPDQK